LSHSLSTGRCLQNCLAPYPPVGTRRLSRAGLVIGAMGDGSPDELARLVDEVFAGRCRKAPSPLVSAFYGVTLDQARDVARRLLNPDGLSLAVVGNPTNLAPTPTLPDPPL
jgi:hypothetical protein